MDTVLYEKKDLETIRDELLKGKIIAFPTDTVFGLACVYDDLNAINKIMKAKNRSYDKALPMMCSSKKMIEQVAVVNANARKLMDRLMPGPLTLIYEKKNLPDIVTLGKKTIAIRMPDDKWIIELIIRVNKPLLVTSANLSDSGSLLKWESVYGELNTRIDGIVKADATGNAASTIVDVTDDIRIIRSGPISEEEIREAL